MAGATQAKVPTQDTGLGDLLKLFSSQQGTGNTTTTATSSASPEANGNAAQLLSQLQGGMDPKTLEELANHIIDTANQKVGVGVGESIGAGNRAYSDTTLQDTAARARAYATQAIAKEQLGFVADSQRTAASLIGNQLNSSKSTTTKAATKATPLGNAMSAAAGLVGAYGLAKKAPKMIASATSGLSQAAETLGLSSGQGDLTGAIGSEGTEEQLQTINNLQTSIEAQGTGVDASVTALDAMTTDFGVETGLGVADAGTSALIDAGTGDIALDAGATILESVAEDSFIEEAAVAAAWIICTELNKQCRLPNRWYIHGAKEFASYDEFGKQGYYIWAIPSVQHLRKHPDSLYSKFLEVIFNARAEYLSAKAGQKKARKTVLGFVTTHGLYWMCWTLARTVARKPQNWQSLYLQNRGGN